MKSKQRSGGYSPSFRQLAIELYLEGHTLKEVEEKLGVSDATVSCWLRKAGIRHHKRAPHTLTRAILEAYAIGHGSTTIARLLNTPERTVTNVLHMARVTRDHATRTRLAHSIAPPPDQEELLSLARRYWNLRQLNDVLEEEP